MQIVSDFSQSEAADRRGQISPGQSFPILLPDTGLWSGQDVSTQTQAHTQTDAR